MHKIALESKEPCKLWADGSGAGIEEVDRERRDHIDALLNILFLCGAGSQPVGGS
jgi:hypothetical protein